MEPYWMFCGYVMFLKHILKLLDSISNCLLSCRCYILNIWFTYMPILDQMSLPIVYLIYISFLVHIDAIFVVWMIWHFLIQINNLVLLLVNDSRVIHLIFFLVMFLFLFLICRILLNLFKDYIEHTNILVHTLVNEL